MRERFGMISIVVCRARTGFFALVVILPNRLNEAKSVIDFASAEPARLQDGFEEVMHLHFPATSREFIAAILEAVLQSRVEPRPLNVMLGLCHFALTPARAKLQTPYPLAGYGVCSLKPNLFCSRVESHAESSNCYRTSEYRLYQILGQF